MNLSKLTKAELVQHAADLGAELVAARLEISTLKAPKAVRTPYVRRFYDEFATRGEALLWAKSHGGIVGPRPVQRAES